MVNYNERGTGEREPIQAYKQFGFSHNPTFSH